jgi:hypothetical protein
MKLNGVLTSILRLRKNSKPSFIGFVHNQKIGIKSKYYTIPLSNGANTLARIVSEEAGLSFIANSADPSNREQLEYLKLTFIPALATHPHTAAIFLVATGDEVISARDLAMDIQEIGIACEYVVISEISNPETVTSAALAAANELKMQALSGFDRIKSPTLAIGFDKEPSIFPELKRRLEALHFLLSVQVFGQSRSTDLSTFALSGTHALLSFTPANDYPSGTQLSPVINIASESEFHHLISTEFDLQCDATVDEIIEKVLHIFGLVPVITEATLSYEPLFASNRLGFTSQSEAEQICLVPLNPVISPLLLDIINNEEGFFLGENVPADPSRLDAKKIIFVGTGSRADVPPMLADPSVETTRINVSDCGSMHQLAEKLIAHRSS